MAFKRAKYLASFISSSRVRSQWSATSTSRWVLKSRTDRNLALDNPWRLDFFFFFWGVVRSRGGSVLGRTSGDRLFLILPVAVVLMVEVELSLSSIMVGSELRDMGASVSVVCCLFVVVRRWGSCVVLW